MKRLLSFWDVALIVSVYGGGFILWNVMGWSYP